MFQTLYSSLVITTISICYFAFNGITGTVHLSLIGFNSLISSYAIFGKEERPLTLHKMVNLFILIFFVIANSTQYITHINVLTFACSFTRQNYIEFQFVVALILVLFNITYLLFLHGFSSKRKLYRGTERVLTNKRTLLVLSYMGLFLVLVQFRHNPILLFFRGTDDSFIKIVNQPTQESSQQLIFAQFIRPVPICCLIIGYITNCSKQTKVLLWISALLALFPTALARNQAAMYWLPMFVLILRNKLRHNIAMWTMIGAIFVLFPFFGLFRRWNGNLNFAWSLEFLNKIDFDASQIFMAVIKRNVQTAWEQVLGPLFFYIPRSIWPDKPVGSGHELVTQFRGYFTNVSMPYFGEGYVNGGWLGVGIFTVFLAWFCSKLDNVYWRSWRMSKSLNQGIYLFLLGAFIFIMRGDLLSSTAYTVGTIVAYVFCALLATNYKVGKIRLR